MIDRIIEFSIRNRTLVIAGGLLLALCGVYAVYHTPMDAIPDLSENQVVVFADWPGHSPQEIEDQITYPLSKELQGLAGVRVVRSSSEFNFSSISVILDDGVDLYFARQQINERLARAGQGLPSGVVPYLAPDALATGQILWYTVEGPGYDLGRLRSIQDWYVRGQLAGVPGVAEVAGVGGHIVEYQIALDPRRLAQHGLTPGAVLRAVADANAAVGGNVVEKANAEFIVRAVGWLGAGARDDADVKPRIIRELEQTVLPLPQGAAVLLGDVAQVTLGGQFRRGVLERDGNEVTGGVVMMRCGENPLEVTRRLQEKIRDLAGGLPPGVKIVPVYDRTPLIESAVATVTGTLVEAILSATLCVLVVLLHFRTSLVIAVTLPLAALASFVVMWLLRRFGVADIQTNVMSLAGIAVSIGILVDSSIVIAENVMHSLHAHFGERPVSGDVRHLVLPACRTVGRPIFFSVAIMLISFLPVFALGGIQGKMFRPLAFTKSFAMLAVAVLAITLVPALCTLFIRGRLRDERRSWLVRSVIDVYRPVLDYLLTRPAPLAWLLAVTFLVGCAPLGSRGLLMALLFAALVITALVTRTWRGTAACAASLVVVALLAEQRMRPLVWQRTTPLDEGMVMDMPITVPRASITEAADDLKMRDMVLCRFPEVEMVIGKAGRAESPADPAPVDMIETMVDFRPREFWPKRKLPRRDAERQTETVLAALVERKLVAAPEAAAKVELVDEVVTAALSRYDGVMREFAFQRNREFETELRPRLVHYAVRRTVEMLQSQGKLSRPLTGGDIALVAAGCLAQDDHHLDMSPSLNDLVPLAQHAGRELARLGFVPAQVDLFDYRPNTVGYLAEAAGALLGQRPATFFTRLYDDVLAEHRAEWGAHLRRLNAELRRRACATYTRMSIEELLARSPGTEPKLAEYVAQVRRFRAHPPDDSHAHHDHAAMRHSPELPAVAPQPELKTLQEELADRLQRTVLLWRSDSSELTDPGGELDRALQMPGWANVWTRPIQNRVDMLATGVSTDVGIRVLGRNLDDVVKASEAIAAVVKRVPGAVGVTADQIRGKGYVEVRVDRDRAARCGVSVADVNEVVETALGGKLATTTVEGRERHPVRVYYARPWREDEESIRGLLVPARTAAPAAAPHFIPLADLADVRTTEGPASIKSENGLLRNYVRLNVQGRSAAGFVAEARRALEQDVELPEGVYLEWTGQFEHDAQAARTLFLVAPLVVGLILLLLYLTYHDLADALLMLLAVPGAIAGGVLFQWLLGYDFSVTVLVGYIACFGMATSTGVIMLVYLREALAKAGGLENVSLAQLRQAVMDGAVHRLRPKLLTEGTAILGLAPMLWATGTGAEVIKPMAAPVLGGILIADEVIDLLLPVLFYQVRSWRWRSTHASGASGGEGGEKPDWVARHPLNMNACFSLRPAARSKPFSLGTFRGWRATQVGLQ